MDQNITIHDFSKHLFWDVDINAFDLNIYPEQMTLNVLEYGSFHDWQLLKLLYGKEKLKNIVLSLRNIDDLTLNYLSVYFNVDKTEFRCFTHKQLVKNYWNY
jgi:hypothetical protein